MKLVLLLALVACDAGQKSKLEVAPKSARRDTRPRYALETRNVPVALPRHGMALQTFGMGGYSQLEIVDTDAKTLHYLEETFDGTGKQVIDRTISLTTTQIDTLRTRAEATWREVPNGPMPQVTDVAQHLYILDGDDGFELHEKAIGIEEVATGRPQANQLALAIERLSP